MKFPAIEKAQHVGQRIIDVCREEKLNGEQSIYVIGTVYSELCMHCGVTPEDFKDINDNMTNDFKKRYVK